MVIPSSSIPLCFPSSLQCLGAAWSKEAIPRSNQPLTKCPNEARLFWGAGILSCRNSMVRSISVCLFPLQCFSGTNLGGNCWLEQFLGTGLVPVSVVSFFGKRAALFALMLPWELQAGTGHPDLGLMSPKLSNTNPLPRAGARILLTRRTMEPQNHGMV